MANWLDYFFGKGGASAAPSPSLGLEKAEHGSFPSKEDARYALQQGYGYGSGFEPYIEGKRAHIYDQPYTGSESDVIAAPSDNVDLTKFGSLSELGKINALQAQTALAVNRNPIAALGYDPHQINLQTKFENPLTHGGMYSRDQDRTWVNVEGSDIPSSAAHEAIHRGLYRVGEKEPWMNEAQQAQADEARKLMRELPGGNQENTVRYLMATQIGDPEQYTGPESDRQREKALNLYRQQSYYFGGIGGNRPRADDINAEVKLRRLEELAAEQRKNRRPGGPR